MEELLKKLKNCSRLMELEDSIPYWESRIPEQRNRIGEMQWNLRQKEQALAACENPTVFQRLLGRAEEKKKLLNRQLQELTSARMAAQWELEGLEKKIQAGKQERLDLSDSREVYATARVEAILTPAQESRLMMEEISAFVPLAMETAWRILDALEESRPWMQRDTVGQNSRKTECLARAEEGARQLCEILSLLPEGIAPVGSYLSDPYAYLWDVNSEEEQLERLNRAREQLRTLQNQLKLVLGE